MKVRGLVTLHGAFEVDNFGDILLFQLFLGWVRSHGYEVCAPLAPQSLQREYGLSPVSVKDSILRSSALVCFGGGYFGEPNRGLLARWKWGFKLWEKHLSIIDRFLAAELPVGVFGVGLGPVSNIPARMRMVKLLSKADVVAVRDREGMDWAIQYGLDAKRLVEVADAALTIPRRSTPVSSAVGGSPLPAPRAQRIPVLAGQLDRSASTSEQWFKLHDEVRRFVGVRRAKWRVVGLVDQRGTRTSEWQRGALIELFDSLNMAPEFITYDGVDSFVEALGGCELVITTKLHIGIVATALGGRVISVPSHQKTIRFYRQVGRSDCCYPFQSLKPGQLDLAEHATLACDADTVRPAVLLADKTKELLGDFLEALPTRGREIVGHG